MSNIEASNAHKKAASDHQECAKHHTMAAEQHEKNNVEEAKTLSSKAMGCCETASKQSTTACGCSTK
jgi:hypothetical protein